MLQQLAEYGVAKPETDVEIYHPETGALITVAEAYWPEGLQPGLGEPVILELDKSDVDQELINDLNIKVFYSSSHLVRFVKANTKNYS